MIGDDPDYSARDLFDGDQGRRFPEVDGVDPGHAGDRRRTYRR